MCCLSPTHRVLSASLASVPGRHTHTCSQGMSVVPIVEHLNQFFKPSRGETLTAFCPCPDAQCSVPDNYNSSSYSHIMYTIQIPGVVILHYHLLTDTANRHTLTAN